MKGSLFFFGLLVMVVIGAGIHYLANVDSPPGEKYVVGVVNPNAGSRQITLGFLAGLAELGFEEGRNLTVLRWEKKQGMERAVRDMIAAKADLLFTVTTPATRMAKELTRENGIPVIFAMHSPVESGIIGSLSHPGGNLTGVQISGSVPKSLEWFLKIFPGTQHIFVPIKFDTQAARLSLKQLREAARTMGVKINAREVDTEKELNDVLGSLPGDVDALFLLNSIFISSQAEKIIETARKRKLPVGASIGKGPKGAVVSYSPQFLSMGKQASRLASQVFAGERPADLPAEIAFFFLTINLEAADQLGLDIPNDILVQADSIIR